MIVIPSAAGIRRAVAILESGGLVAFPTETVYGLGADAENPLAVAGIYAAKGRPARHPVIVHVGLDADIGRWAVAVPHEAYKLMDAFWPGPLTLILKRAPHIPDTVSGGQDTIGMRCPSHPVAQALLSIFKGGKGGIAAPSANKFGHVSPTTAQHVQDEFGDDVHSPVQCILDGGQSEVGIESAIVDLSRMQTHGPVLLRPGQIGIAQISDVIGMPLSAPDSAAPRASGTLDAHYAPHTPVALVDADRLTDTLQQLNSAGRRVALIHRSTHSFPMVAAQRALPDNPSGYAHALYAALRSMDAAMGDIILVVSPPDMEAWQGINDRLRRAAFDSVGVLQQLF